MGTDLRPPASPRPAARAAPLLLAALLLAGCASTPAPTATGDSGHGTTNAAPAEHGLPLPTWAVRDAWTYAIGSAKATYVVTADAGADWVMDTDSPDRAFQNARDDVSRLGPQRKSDLAGSQGDDRVQFFQWPLTDGKTWGTQWDHQPVTVTAHVRGPLAHLEAVDRNGTRIYNYTYDSAAGWFSSLKHYAPSGDLLIDLELTAHAHNWTGTAVRYALKGLYAKSGESGNADAVPLQPDPAATDLWLAYHLHCGQGGGYSIALEPVGAGAGTTGYTKSDACTDNDFEGGVPGDLASPWTLTYSWGGGAPTTYSVEVVQRTVESIQVG
jgi:hypothetical protein